ncbi:MAG: hypothetical protein KZQ64_16350 [gamma proteobacterium symbiont of Bathyaustriella thionipta]|nr:hypothetical protein [gamma proteobacterium symbiont of Bathyaustriella thionipta]MCU7949858.1 hypothetical protein [gamma proteobacterium symbiont of Bathyaustriella thionipta]MCU7954938.1 hypothetical protein [gamma proteobacterium symbiont of Bathyaustriella thionipta]MCU7956443.1 hypothetical protein [gamma proteobacterium symbiont of Bathyaustriella thionipta]MCU7966914.1 hypothetical protein [gamma proteobacterium symbiont of Bathyaustriella thionipta]
MVKRISFYQTLFFILLFIPHCLLAADASIEPEVKIVLNTSEVEMGKFILVRIEYRGDSVPEISNIQQWYDDFFVDRRDEGAEKFPDGLIVYTETMRLYPRKTGDIVLASVALGGAIAQAVKIKVTPAIRSNINGTPQWQALPETIWQGQTVEISILQNLLNSSNQVVTEEAQFPGFYVERLDQKVTTQNTIKTVQLHWRITAQTSGLIQLDPPAIVQRGRGRWRFYLPRATIQVKPLPSYIPPTVPVGRLSIRTGVMQINNKPLWTVEIQNEGQLPDEIYGIRTQLSKLTGASLESVEVSASRPDSTSPLTSIHFYRVLVPDFSWGFNDGPEVVIPYFDVDEGSLKKMTEKLPGVWYFSTQWLNLFFIVLVLLSVIIVIVCTRSMKTFLAWRHYRCLLKQAGNPHELRRLLIAQGPFLTLSDWSASKQSKRANQIAAALNCLCFSPSSEISLDEIKQIIIVFSTYRRWLFYQPYCSA